MKSTILTIILFVFSLSISCKKNESTPIHNNKKDTLWLKESIVVFISPSLKKIDQLKKEQGENFYTIADDANYYYANATEHLDSLHQKYLNQNESIVIAYKDGGKVKIIPKYKNNWYSVVYKNKTFKILDLIDFKEEYSLFLSPINSNYTQ